MSDGAGGGSARGARIPAWPRRCPSLRLLGSAETTSPKMADVHRHCPVPKSGQGGGASDCYLRLFARMNALKNLPST
jgi:hypothetical protein